MRLVTRSRWWRERYPSWAAPVIGDVLDSDFGPVLWRRGRFTVHSRARWVLAAVVADDVLVVVAALVIEQAWLVVPVLLATWWAFIVAPVVHELVHAFVARRRGYTVVRFGLTGRGAFVTTVPAGGSSRPADAVAILIAAPLTDIACALALLAAASGTHGQLFVLFVVAGVLQMVNGLANLMPLGGTDGGRTRVAFALARRSDDTRQRTAEPTLLLS